MFCKNRRGFLNTFSQQADRDVLNPSLYENPLEPLIITNRYKRERQHNNGCHCVKSLVLKKILHQGKKTPYPYAAYKIEWNECNAEISYILHIRSYNRYKQKGKDDEDKPFSNNPLSGVTISPKYPRYTNNT